MALCRPVARRGAFRLRRIGRRGLTGAKPEAVCHWAFEMVAARPDDTLDDLFPGSGAVAEAWRTWRLKFALPDEPAARVAAPIGVQDQAADGAEP